MAAYDREHLLSVMLDKELKVLGIDTVAMGILDKAASTAREILKSAIIISAKTFILVHNHPGGTPQPSRGDDGFVEFVLEKAKWLGVPLLDQIIVGEESRYYSFYSNAVFEKDSLKGFGIAHPRDQNRVMRVWQRRYDVGFPLGESTWTVRKSDLLYLG